MKNIVIAALIAIVAIGGTIAAFAAVHETTANVEVRVWQRVSDGALYLSTRPEGGTWTTHDAEALDMSELSRSRNFRQSTFVTVAVPVEVEIPDSTGTAEPNYNPDGTLNPDMERAGLWVYLWTDTSSGSVRVQGSVFTVVSRSSNQLEVSVASGALTGSFCNPGPVLSGVETNLGCEGISGVLHTEIDALSAIWQPLSFTEGVSYNCVRHSLSTPDVSVWACVARVE